MILISHNDDPAMVWPPQQEIDNIYPYPHEVNITDGSEFLDDAIRTKDQPLGVGSDQIGDRESRIQNSEFRIRESDL